MNYSPQNFETLRREIHKAIEKKVDSIGIYARIFSRIKNPSSTQTKLIEKEDYYRKNSKKLQDFLGIRVTVYFEDDIETIAETLKKHFIFDSESIDIPNHENFSPKRHNVILKIPAGMFLNNPNSNLIDETFELQIRTIFSEGWHEIEHDLRYKHKEKWVAQPVQSRGLNSILATLEMCDWGVSKLTNDIAYNAYQTGDLQSLIINKFRLRLATTEIDAFFTEKQKDKAFLKNVLRSKRKDLLNILSRTNGNIPLSSSNLLWVLAKTQGIFIFEEHEFPSPVKDILIENDMWK